MTTEERLIAIERKLDLLLAGTAPPQQSGISPARQMQIMNMAKEAVAQKAAQKARKQCPKQSAGK